MTDERPVRTIVKAQPTMEGAGVHLKRAFGFTDVPGLDPFLMLDDFRSDIPEYHERGFPWHPHRGIETITYVTRGQVAHGDSMGNSGTIHAGDVQWMTAGSGIIHQEMPKGDTHGAMHGFQLWANLPASQKMMAPRYRGITASEIPEVTLENGTVVKVIAGNFQGTRGPVSEIVIDPEYLDITVPAGESFVLPVAPEKTAFIYITGGNGFAGESVVDNTTLVVFGTGTHFKVSAGNDTSISFLAVSGIPLNEPVAWRGPIVMNTQEELDTAFEEYQKGTFIKHS